MAITLTKLQKERICIQYLQNLCKAHGFQIRDAISPFCWDRVKYLIIIGKSGSRMTDELFGYLKSQVIDPYLEKLREYHINHHLEKHYLELEPLISHYKHPRYISGSYVLISLEAKIPNPVIPLSNDIL